LGSSEGYEGFDFVAEFYDHVTSYRERPDVGFYADMARKSGGPVLEIGCGTGRVLIPTAQAGIEIVGLDYSQAMLSTCREKLSREPADVQSRVELVRGDMRRFDLGRTFSLLTTPFRPFQHLITVEDQLSCLATIRRHLVDGGRFVLDLFNPDLNRLVDEKYLDEREVEEPFTMPDGRRVTRRDRIASRDPFNQVQDVELIYYVTHPDGREERLVHAFPFRYLFRFEAEHLLARSGFQVEDVYADYDKSPYGSEYPGELIFVVRKA
jgi:SAM-dependent methyltransferase